MKFICSIPSFTAIRFLIAWLLFCTLLPLQAAARRHEPARICLPAAPGSTLRLAADELQKYIYQRTGRLLPVVTDSRADGKAALVLGCDKGLAGGAEAFSLRREGNRLYLTGGSETGVLYAVYQYAELLGVRFALHGDLLPDTPYRGTLWLCGKGSYAPLFERRGLLPFHDFPEGPDLWDESMYKACLTQMAKMKMNFFSLHTYPHVEPNVWIGLEEDVDERGRVTHAYPTTLANTQRPGAWGYSAMDTRDYCCGTPALFRDSVCASPLVADVLPYPRTQEEMCRVFNRTGELFGRAFSFGHKLGIRFCAGLESPLSIPHAVQERLRAKQIDPASPKARERLYRGIFSRIQKTHTLDFFWLWTPEGWTWGTPSEASIRQTVEDVGIARKVLDEMGNPFGFGLSGWVLGPPDSTTLFDRHLPKGDFMGSLSRLVGQERIDLGYAKLPKERFGMPILWLEDDPALTIPQFWVGRMRSDIAESHAMGCRGIVGNHWRTRSIAPNIMAMAAACWEQDWNPDLGQPFRYEAAAENDLRFGGVGTNYYHGIRGTEDQYLMNTQRYDLKGFRVKVPNGKYRVTFLFAETKYDAPGRRVFDVSVQNSSRLQDIDVCRAVGRDTVYRLTSDEVTVDNYRLDIAFHPKVGETFLSAFIIEGRTADVNQIKGTPYRRCIDVGGGLYKEFEADLSEHTGNKQQRPRDMAALAFYTDYARQAFGHEVGERTAQLLAGLDGTVGNEGHLGFRMPRPTAWITGPGVIQPNERNWTEEAARYAFVDSLEALRPEVKGNGNRQRFDYWLNTFRYLRAVGELGCLRGALDAGMRRADSADNAARRRLVHDELIPLRVALARKWEEMIGLLTRTIETPGELGTLINMESQTRKTYRFLTKYDGKLEAMGGEPLPKTAKLSTQYAQEARLWMTNARTVVERKEDYRPEVAVLVPQGSRTEAPVLMYREPGQRRFKTQPMQPSGANRYTTSLPHTTKGNVIEYYIAAKHEDGRLIYPASAPGVYATWVLTE